MARSRLRSYLRTYNGTTALLLVGGLVAAFVFWMLSSHPSWKLELGILALIFLAGLGFWLAFFAQFVLPVRRLEFRFKAAERLFQYLNGSHGPAVFIQDGEIRAREDEKKRKGPGLIWLDTASAALLRTSVRLKGAVGPGIVFTERKEYLAGTADLHVQNSFIGPKADEDPFEPRQKDELPAEYAARKKRCELTRALTRDGIEIVPNIIVGFRLISEPPEGNTHFGYRKDSVESAIIGRPVDVLASLDNPAERIVDWHKLAGMVAADVWREMLSKFSLSELFETAADQPGRLPQLRALITERLTRRTAQVVDAYGNPTGANMLSREFEMLHRRGIQVRFVNINNLRLPAQVDTQLIESWKGSWLKRAQSERDTVEHQRGVSADKGRRDAAFDYAMSTSAFLGNVDPTATLEPRRVLNLLIRGNLALARKYPQLYRLATDELEQLRNLDGATANGIHPAEDGEDVP